MQDLTVSAVAMENRIGDKAWSLDRIARWTRTAKEQGSDLVLFPELCVPGYVPAPVARELAEPLDGPSVERLTAIARESDIILAAGLIELDRSACYNTHVLIGPDGVIGSQRKIHVPTHERPYWEAGSGIDVFDIGRARIGITPCRDSFFSEMIATLYHKGAELVLMPFGYPTVHRSKYLEEQVHGMSIRYNSWAYGLYSVVCNSAGDREPSDAFPRAISFPGWAGVISPWGRVLQFTRDEGNGEAMVTQTLDPAELADRRGHTNFLPTDMRPDLYLGR